jgi:hypothetical protein
MWATSIIKKMHQVKNRPLGENSTNLVTLLLVYLEIQHYVLSHNSQIDMLIGEILSKNNSV